MVDLFAQYKDLKSQTPKDKMFVLKLLAHKFLGKKWDNFKKIKTAGEGFNLFKEASLMEQMKATRSALRFTTKNARKQYRQVYKSAVKDIKRYTGKKEGFPDLAEIEEGQEMPSLTSSHDATIIAWTPVKFLLPVKLLREKGQATQRHTEGLSAKLFFKVVGYYADPENWDLPKLTLYMMKITPEMSYQEVSKELEPLKADLDKFCDIYELFKFGKASLSKDIAKDADAFDDAFGGESFEDQVKSLYWYYFIYWGLELFMFRYYMSLVTSTTSKIAMRYLTNLFEPVLQKCIENKNLFLGSFETDRTKKKFRVPFEKYKLIRQKDPATFKIKTKSSIYQVLHYNLNLLEKSSLSFETSQVPDEASPWNDFVKYRILGLKKPEPTPEEGEEQKEAEQPKVEEKPEQEEEVLEIPLEDREYSLMQIMTTMINCTSYRRIARQKILERFKKRAEEDKELAEKRIKEIKKQAEKKVRSLNRKISKLKRMKQEDSVEVFQKDIEKFQKRVDEMCETIQSDTQQEQLQQRKRLKKLFEEIAKENQVNEGLSSCLILDLADKLDPESSFKRGFSKFITDNIQKEYSKELEPFYKNLFTIMQPSTQEKVMLIQALEKSGGPGSVKLSLSEEEINEVEEITGKLKQKIKMQTPDVFEGKMIFLSLIVPIADLFEIGIDNHSLRIILSLKITTPKKPQGFKLPPETIKSLLVLNLVKNPVPKNNIIIEGKEKETDPQKAISSTKLNRLITKLHSA